MYYVFLTQQDRKTYCPGISRYESKLAAVGFWFRLSCAETNMGSCSVDIYVFQQESNDCVFTWHCRVEYSDIRWMEFEEQRTKLRTKGIRSLLGRNFSNYFNISYS
jgi:hypothetical protein